MLAILSKIGGLGSLLRSLVGARPGRPPPGTFPRVRVLSILLFLVFFVLSLVDDALLLAVAALLLCIFAVHLCPVPWTSAYRV